jgi:uncharacterized protein
MQDPKKSSPRFVADAMLGSLARKLRALGFDTTYYRRGDDRGILEVALKEGRHILTADRSLAQRAAAGGVSAFLLVGRSDGIRLASLKRLARTRGLTLVRGDSLCSVCGGDLERLRRKDVVGVLPASVSRRHRLFHRCKACGRYYWRGSHWKKLRWLERVLA